MKAHLILPMCIAVSVAAFAFMKVRLKEFAIEEKKLSFQEVKLRVVTDVLAEYEKDKAKMDGSLAKERAVQDELEKAVVELSKDRVQTQLTECEGAKKVVLDEQGAIQGQLATLQADNAQEKAAWEAEIAMLKEKLNAVSPICNYLKPGASVQGCPEKPKPEPPKPAEEKKEEPKPEPPKPAEEKKEEPKPEPPKPAEEKKEEPKPEPPKPAEEKKEEPKPEPPKPEEKKPEPPKPEEKKPEPPKPEEVKPEAPKPEAPKP